MGFGGLKALKAAVFLVGNEYRLTDFGFVSGNSFVYLTIQFYKITLYIFKKLKKRVENIWVLKKPIIQKITTQSLRDNSPFRVA